MLLEQQRRKRIILARQEQDASSRPHALQDYGMQLKLLEQQNKRAMMLRQEQDALAKSHPCAQGQASRGCEVHFMPIEQQKHRRPMVEEQQDDTMSAVRTQTCQLNPDTTPGDREQSVDSVWSTQFTPESTPGFQEEQGPESMHCKPLPFRERPTYDYQ